MPTFEIISLLLLAAVAWLWFDSVQARDVGVGAAKAACASEGLQFLDDTIAIRTLRPDRNAAGTLVLRRTYEFEFSDTGDNRRKGSVVLLGQRVLVINLGLRLAASDGLLH